MNKGKCKLTRLGKLGRYAIICVHFESGKLSAA